MDAAVFGYIQLAVTVIPRARLGAALLALAILMPLASSVALADQAASEPEQHALDLINQARVAEGRPALGWDSRLADIAQWRSDYQVQHGFGHLSSWDPILQRMNAMGINYDAYGEVIFLGTPRTPLESAEEAFATWRASQAHWDWLSSTQFNYIALGMARDADGWYYWTGLLMHVPETAPTVVAYMTGMQLGDRVDGRRRVTVSWSGENAKLFRLQKRVGAGYWRFVTDWTSSTARSLDLRVGRTYSFRVRGRDAAGNRSAWSAILRVAL
jgi:uncharacterized protein YkwD